MAGQSKNAARKKTAKGVKKAAAQTAVEPVLLSGGNPQIAKGEGDDSVAAYIAAMPDWKRNVGRRLDALIAGAVPGVRKAVKWNSPFYGVGDQSAFPKSGNRFSEKNARQTTSWFLSFHCFTNYVKVAFFRGASLRPLPPGASRQKNVRYLDIRENDDLDEAQFADWVRQASKLPSERM